MSYISVVIFVKSETTYLVEVVNNIKNIAAEIIIVSNNDSKEVNIIADKYKAKLVFDEWKNERQQKSIAENLSTNNWLLILHSNEELTRELQDEIEYIFADNKQDKYSAYIIKFKALLKDRNSFGLFSPTKKQLRLYNKTNIKEKMSNSYELNSIAYQRLNNSLKQLNDNYAMERKKLQDSNLTYKFFRFCTIVRSFFYAFLIKRYCVYGRKGVIAAINFAFDC